MSSPGKDQMPFLLEEGCKLRGIDPAEIDDWRQNGPLSFSIRLKPKPQILNVTFVVASGMEEIQDDKGFHR